ncbi:hypothetical protein ERJ75_001360900 [Trypanosoma vivax]|uniref:Uncharacterized protein n=1 Tax=Trypanosoma vivax (strain Y486) TaxID=1055687 RepID=G0UCS3_TRYVY|nr:hypothetical protein TRVL_00360 [Trypanosoma vivax]KAH8607893.1 hypothetical protein ERJ75_001360900 [Trypanosoma vivax]CCC53633.1 conserved hypothetical protein [Trypanosoma vivax Y486]
MGSPKMQQCDASQAFKADASGFREEECNDMKDVQEQSAAPEAIEDEEVSSYHEESSASEGESEELVPFASDEEAIALRATAVKLYNERRYEAALDIQYRIVRHFESKYGATSPKCGLYFLDYGLSQLRMLQSVSSMEAALQPLDQEALEACFINLDVARVCFQKLEAERGEEDVEVQLFLAEVHSAIGQLNVEREDFDGALKEYESELLTYRFLQQEKPSEVPHGRLAAVLYSIADCYMKEGDFEGAEERFSSAIEEIEKFPAGAVAPSLIEELRELLEDARQMKGGRYKKIQESIQAQFAVKEAEEQPTANEFYGEIEGEHPHPYVSVLPNDGECSALSMPQSTIRPIQWNEHSNSMSLSLFPSQVGGRVSEASSSQPVQQVVARRKPKPSQEPKKSQEGGDSPNQSSETHQKRLRVET